MAASLRSGDDVGEKLVFNSGDLVLQGQLFLLQAANEQLVRRPTRLHRHNLIVELAMLFPQLHELLAQFPIVLTLLHWSRSFPAVVVRALTAVEAKYLPVFDSAQATAVGCCYIMSCKQCVTSVFLRAGVSFVVH